MRADAVPVAESGSATLPLDFFPDRRKVLPPEQIERWMAILLALGIVARLVRYALRFPLWGDEAFLSANLLERGYLDMLRPLEYHQVCPLLFLWGQLTVVKLLGFSEFTLRLFSLACSIASLFLFRSLARRVVQGTSLLVAVGVFAVAYPGIRYAAEAKPYQCDLLVSLVLLLFCLGWWQRPQRSRLALGALGDDADCDWAVVPGGLCCRRNRGRRGRHALDVAATSRSRNRPGHVGRQQNAGAANGFGIGTKTRLAGLVCFDRDAGAEFPGDAEMHGRRRWRPIWA